MLNGACVADTQDACPSERGVTRADPLTVPRATGSAGGDPSSDRGPAPTLKSRFRRRHRRVPERTRSARRRLFSAVGRLEVADSLSRSAINIQEVATTHAHSMVGQQQQEFEVVLRRDWPGTPWGFRLQGGYECQAPLAVQRVSRDVF